MKEVKQRAKEFYIKVPDEETRQRAKILSAMAGVTTQDYVKAIIDSEYEKLQLLGAIE